MNRAVFPALTIAAAVLSLSACAGDTKPGPEPTSAGAEKAVHASSVNYDKPGYVTEVHDGRLWVFMADSKEYASFKKIGEPAKVVTRIAAGPNRMTVKAPDASIIDGYLLSRPGYVTEVHDGRLWVFMADSKEYASFKKIGEPAKVVTRIAAGPNRMTVKATDASVIDGYLLSRPGYVTEVHDGRLWVFEAGSEDYRKFKEHGEPAKMVTRIAAGPNRMTIKSTDAAIIDGYLATGN